MLISPVGFVVSPASEVKLQPFVLSVTAHKGSVDTKSKQQQDLLQRAKEQSFHSLERDPSRLSLLALVACFYSLIWPHPHPADWSILQRADWSILQSTNSTKLFRSDFMIFQFFNTEGIIKNIDMKQVHSGLITNLFEFYY